MDSPKDDIGSHVLASITCAIHDKSSSSSLQDVYNEISSTNVANLLDPLEILPLLLPNATEAAALLIRTVGENCSAKEVVVAVQEALECLTDMMNAYDDDDLEPDSTILSPTLQLERMILALTYAIPRFVSNRKSTSDILEQILCELARTIAAVTPTPLPDHSRILVISVSTFCETIFSWVKNRSDDMAQISLCSEKIFSLLEKTLYINANGLQTSLAQRTFEKLWPNLVMHSSVNPDWESRELVVSRALDAASALGFTIETLARRPTIGSLILLSHSDFRQCHHMNLLEIFLPPVTTSIRTNVAFEESLAFLLACVNLISQEPTPRTLPLNLAIQLSVLLPPITSAHPDAPTRHMLFRLLAAVLSLIHPQFRLQIFEDMLTNSGAHSPQMQIASISLIKDSVLHALSRSNDVQSDVFGTSQFLDRLGSVLFRTHPPDLFQGASFDIKSFLLSPEPKRLAECLGLLYVVIQRDKNNRTGIRHTDRIEAIENNILGPLRRFLGSNGLDPCDDDIEAVMTIAALQTSLQRVDEALEGLRNTVITQAAPLHK